MNIDVSFDQSTSSLPSGFVAAVKYVASLFDRMFTNPVTINIDVGYGEIDGTPLGRNDLGESYAPQYMTESYSAVRSALQIEGAPGSSTLPASSPLSGNLRMSEAEAQALGLTSAVSTSYVGFSSSLPFSYAIGATPRAGEYYFIGVVDHEFTEDTGRVSLLNRQPSDYAPIDLYRYSAPGVRDRSTGGSGSTAYFSINNGAKDLGTWNNNPRNGDLADWYGEHIPHHGHDAFNDYSSSGVINAMSHSDITLMRALGWTTAGPGAASASLLGQHIAASFVTGGGGLSGTSSTDHPGIGNTLLAKPHA